mmetsp:Transcript_62811/g.187289  ORF Transcript_62811/g.187289 Transcript_62811/m.187289 type:complete len:259 (-) Transcript_62811:8-784(-)
MPVQCRGLADAAADVPRGTIGMQTIKGWLGTRGEKTLAIHHTGIYKLHLDAQATLDSANVRQSVKLPPGVKEDEWIASQALGIYEEVCLVVSLLEDMCSEESCPCMTAGKHMTYSWADERNPKPVSVSAPDYMRKLVDYAWQKLSDGQLIPKVDGQEFPEDFKQEVHLLMKRFFRVYAHAYIHHFEEIREVKAEAHLNMFLKHFLAFVAEFKLVSGRDMLPLKGLVEKWSKQEAEARELQRRTVQDPSPETPHVAHHE